MNHASFAFYPLYKNLLHRVRAIAENVTSPVPSRKKVDGSGTAWWFGEMAVDRADPFVEVEDGLRHERSDPRRRRARPNG